jgi:hypothetical protein
MSLIDGDCSGFADDSCCAEGPYSEIGCLLNKGVRCGRGDLV